MQTQTHPHTTVDRAGALAPNNGALAPKDEALA
eukprot:CAMPEP_0196652724 /NCGR_PEP_ID=MMETSP1086-20130531/2104_1 /TAXON_ID=77921 /ORGANISM="Cyanoptyche  gloeocystis , Strain SAG4.97" /LENGTH=32 /DNA_ID= /DNA_START= /DNA_END= /DNA_ORIENTATION=